MTLSPAWRTRLSGMVAGVVAVWLGAEIAHQDLALPLLFVAAVGAVIVIMLQPLPIPTLLLGGVLIGYIVGNRGFAQISLTDRFPLLPAELVLLVNCSVLVVQSAWRRDLPLRWDVMNFAVLLWIAVGSVRLGFDVRAYGAAALRDFAMVYYGVFFFLAQRAAQSPASRQFLLRCMTVSCVILLVTQFVYQRMPDLFLSTLTIRGVPIIYYKGDLAGLFMASGAAILFFAFERNRRWWQLALSLLLMAGAMSINNRSLMVGVVLVAGLLMVSGRWRFAVIQGTAGVVAATVLLFVAYVSNKPWQQSALHGVYERVLSVTDPFGQRAYSGEDTFYKGDNNRFRVIWWNAVFEETVQQNPWVGLGFGYDLAARFVREYYPDNSEEFNTRSPHNVALTVFGRMGVIGLIPFVLIVVVMARNMIRAARDGPTPETALWSAAWIIMAGAWFGVVLEGPMGAVVFWIALGIANANQPTATTDVENQEVPSHALTEEPQLASTS
jgi:O-antigen ligase